MKEKNPKVSVIVPVYNNEKYLNECINSIINQTLKDIEIICINDGSDDNSWKILKDYAKKDDRIIILDELHQGAGKSREKGIKISRGDYIFLADSDDILESELLELTYENGVNNDSDIVFFKVNYFNHENNSIFTPEKFDLSEFFPNQQNFKEFAFKWDSVKPTVFNRFTNIWSCLFNGDFLRYNNFCFPEKLSFNDVPLHVQSLILAKRISFVPKALYNYRLINEQSITTRTHKNRNVFDIFTITKILENFLIKNHLQDIFKLEVIIFKIDHYTYHLNKLNNNEIIDEFFNRIKQEFIQIDISENELNQLSENFKIELLSIIKSSYYSEYKIRKKIYQNNQQVINNYNLLH